MQAYYWR